MKAENPFLEVARRLIAGGKIGPRADCYICGRGLTDPESIERFDWLRMLARSVFYTRSKKQRRSSDEAAAPTTALHRR
jgi:hypothetical protein